jgi:hypothetical protein
LFVSHRAASLKKFSSRAFTVAAERLSRVRALTAIELAVAPGDVARPRGDNAQGS